MTSLKLVPYSPATHDKLLQFMIEQYPHRSPDYIRWWLNQIRCGDESLWQRNVMVYDGEDVVGCMTMIRQQIVRYGKKESFDYEANTIVKPQMRGMGIGRLLYAHLRQQSNRCTIGLTKAAYLIQQKLFPDCVHLSPVRVYVTITPYVLSALLHRFRRAVKKTATAFPKMRHLGDVEFCAFSNFAEFQDWPQNGAWLSDQVQTCRDVAWLEDRFEKIWRANAYYKYRIVRAGKCVGYAVYRLTRLYGFNMIAIVDFRCERKFDEDYVFKMAQYLAKEHRCGFSICLTNRKYPIISLQSIRIRTPKCIAGVAVGGMFSPNMLFTSADSDLDFVYYE